ncbi:oligosaccharide flippase family protein [Lentibacillus saliphilus]|uniref:oligosaccharide flippase family protein n=1 Tax=Lentibacillus saliphilus TaxID=2737028 RepID=UPI001C30F062|nr:oligosaccharide flippase family protein [Lentibacillus saliphilus]
MIRNLSWIFGANIIVSLSKWFILVVIARILTPEDVGAYSLAFAIGSPITLFANMKLRSLYITETIYGFSNYMHTRSILSSIAFIFLVVIALVIYPQYFLIIILVGLNKIFDLQSDMYYALPHKEEDMDYIGKLMIIKHVITLLGFFLSLLTLKNLIFALIIQLVLQTLFLYFVEKRSIYKKYIISTKPIEINNIKQVLLIGVPLGFVQLIVSLNTTYPRYLIEHFESPKTLGYFSAIAYILVIGNLMMNAVSQAYIPFLAKQIKKRNFKSFRLDVFLKLNIFATGLGGVLIAFSLLFGEFFLGFVYGSDYANYADILILMSIAMTFAFIGWIFDVALIAMRYISIQPKISFVILLINLIIGYELIKAYGVYGATYTLIVTNILQVILRAFFVNRRINHLRDSYAQKGEVYEE